MIAFATAVTRPDVYRRCAQPGIDRAKEPDSVVLAEPSQGTIFQAYNALMEEAGRLEDLEALVLLHQDTEIVGDDFAVRVREALADPDVGILGCVGAIGVRSIAWWEGSVTLASFLHRYDEHGGGDVQAFSWGWSEAPPYARLGEVETLDGFLLVLSPWVTRNLRFDEDLGMLHGYDLDFCLQVREAGKKVVTADVRAIHHHSLDPISEPESWIQAHMQLAEKWDGRMPGIGTAAGDWKWRTRRAEAETDAARAEGHKHVLEVEARTEDLERALAETRGSFSWRITAPLRLLSRLRATR